MGINRSLTVKQRIDQLEKEAAYYRYKLWSVVGMIKNIDPLNKLYGDLNKLENEYSTKLNGFEARIESLKKTYNNLNVRLINYIYDGTD